MTIKAVLLLLLALCVARLVLPGPRLPAWSALVPLLPLALAVWYVLGLGLELDLVPALLLAGALSAAGTAEFVARRRGAADRPAPTRPRSLRIVGRAAASGLLVLAIAYVVTLQSGSVISAPEALPRERPLAPTETGRAGSDPVVTVVAAHHFLRAPRDLAFNPRVEGELWIVNGADASVAIIHDVYGEAPTISYRRDGAASHFMHRPSAIAFGGEATTIGVPGTFATAQESRDDAAPLLRTDFMGPTLWSSDLAVFAHDPGPRLQGSHLDMLHESPLAMGIAWERDNVYWVFGGHAGTITRYDFAQDHGVGHHDHGDGVIRHYGTGVVERVAGVPSHLALHRPSGTLYIADTANGGVLTLDIGSGTLGREGPRVEPGVDSRYVDGADYGVLVASGTLVRPSGLELVGEVLIVSDHGTGIVHAFTLDGRETARIDTGLGAGALMGLAAGGDGRLYAVDAAGGRIVRVELAPLVGALEHAGPESVEARRADGG